MSDIEEDGPTYPPTVEIDPYGYPGPDGARLWALAKFGGCTDWDTLSKIKEIERERDVLKDKAGALATYVEFLQGERDDLIDERDKLEDRIDELKDHVVSLKRELGRAAEEGD